MHQCSGVSGKDWLLWRGKLLWYIPVVLGSQDFQVPSGKFQLERSSRLDFLLGKLENIHNLSWLGLQEFLVKGGVGTSTGTILPLSPLGTLFPGSGASSEWVPDLLIVGNYMGHVRSDGFRSVYNCSRQQRQDQLLYGESVSCSKEKQTGSLETPE